MKFLSIKKIVFYLFSLACFFEFTNAQNTEPTRIGICNVATNLKPIEVESTVPNRSIAYANLGEALYAINQGVHTGEINIEVCFDSKEPESAVLNSAEVSPANYSTLTIRPLKDNLTISSKTGFVALIALNGADNVIIDGDNPNSVGENRNLTLRGWGGRSIVAVQTRQYLTQTHLTEGSKTRYDSANKNIIKNLHIYGQAIPSFGIAIGGFNPGSSGKQNNYNRIENCDFRNVRTGIFSSGDMYGQPNIGTIITKNELSSIGADRVRLVGIEAIYEDQLQITENNIGGLEAGFGEIEDQIGILLGGGRLTNTNFNTNSYTSLGFISEFASVSNTLVARNKINGIVAGERQSAAGIYLIGNKKGVNIIQNNVVTGVFGEGIKPNVITGIFVGGHEEAKIQVFNNSVSMTGERNSDEVLNPSFAISFVGEDISIELTNNIFYNSQISTNSNSGKNYAVGFATKTFEGLKTPFAFLNSNHNLFFINSEKGSLFRLDSLQKREGTDIESLNRWQKTSQNDTNSMSKEPLFINPINDLRLQEKSPARNAGIALPNVIDDILGNKRPKFIELADKEKVRSNSPKQPDIGAFEAKSHK
ncbi:MAG: hypothetical protein MUC29_11990 [Pyrinomonadaceae bacterium]|nr:hypothetical protein [Pyrinomonadaceae bacterium]